METGTIFKFHNDLDTDQITPYNSKLGQRIIKTWTWNTADKAFNYYFLIWMR